VDVVGRGLLHDVRTHVMRVGWLACGQFLFDRVAADAETGENMGFVRPNPEIRNPTAILARKSGGDGTLRSRPGIEYTSRIVLVERGQPSLGGWLIAGEGVSR